MDGTPAHAGKRPGGHRHPETKWIVLCAALAAVLVATGIVIAVVPRRPRVVTTAAAASPQPAAVALAVIGTTPAAGATNVPSSTSVTVALSTPLAAGSPMPSLTPPVPGTWSELSPTELGLVADGPLAPGSSETLVIPGGPSGLEAADGQTLPSTTTVHFTVAPGSTLRLQQLLAELGYLPVAFTPAAQPTAPQQEADPQPGTFTWRWPGLPASLTSQWAPGTFGVLTKGAVMRFETAHGLRTDGAPGPQVWTTLLQSAAAGDVDPQPYDYVFVSTARPESATIYRDGAVAYTTPANTGIAAAPTATGTFTVYARYQVTTMSGTNPTGSHYTDPGVPWVSYFNGGDALHGFIRPGYGYPQSLGCVELPPANAAVVWPMTPLGTLVTVA